jgi:anti-sigma-K factor RskA
VSGTEERPAYSCGDVDDVAAELGLGVLGGVERVRALAHLDDCPRCRALVEEMAEVSDALFELGPEVEPPAGFESRLLARREQPRRSSRLRRRWPVAVAAALSTAAAVAAVVSLAAPGSPGFRVEHPAAVAALGGRSLVAVSLHHGSAEVGQLFVYTGRPSWMFMTVESGVPSRPVTCEIILGDGRTVDVGSFTIAAGYRSWGSTVNVDPSNIRAVRLVTTGGAEVASATL